VKSAAFKQDQWEFFRDGAQEWRWRCRGAEEGSGQVASFRGYSRLSDCIMDATLYGYFLGRKHRHRRCPLEGALRITHREPMWAGALSEAEALMREVQILTNRLQHAANRMVALSVALRNQRETLRSRMPRRAARLASN
jgi:hypothetical protein